MDKGSDKTEAAVRFWYMHHCLGEYAPVGNM
jgi:hypothetical protein